MKYDSRLLWRFFAWGLGVLRLSRLLHIKTKAGELVL